MANWFPTKLEKAQTAAAYGNLENARDRLRSEEERFERELASRRERAIEQFTNAQKLEDYRLELQQARLGVTVPAFINDSQRSNRKRLNVIAKIVARPGATLKANEALMPHIHLALSEFVDCISTGAEGGIRFYNAAKPIEANLMGDALVAQISSLTHTEPTCLVELSIARSNAICIGLSCWGWGPDVGSPDISPRAYLLVGQRDRTPAEDLLTALRLVLSAINDRFLTITQLHAPPSLTAFDQELASELLFQTPSFPNDHIVLNSLDKILATSHRGTLDAIAVGSPALACEAASRAALDAHATESTDRAREFLQLALRYYGRQIGWLGVAEDIPQSHLTRLSGMPLFAEALAAFSHMPSQARRAPNIQTLSRSLGPRGR